MLSKVYLKLTTGKQEDLNLMNIKSVDLSSDDFNFKYRENFKVPRDGLMKLSDEEIKNHKAFITEMKNSMWIKIR